MSHGFRQRGHDAAPHRRQRDAIVDFLLPRPEALGRLLDDERGFLIDFVAEGAETSVVGITDDGERLPEADAGQRVDGFGGGEQGGQIVGVHPFPEDFPRRIAALHFPAQDFPALWIAFHRVAGIGFVDFGFLGFFGFGRGGLGRAGEIVFGVLGRKGRKGVLHREHQPLQRRGQQTGGQFFVEMQEQGGAGQDKAGGDETPKDMTHIKIPEADKRFGTRKRAFETPL